jgi:hypothetical protein
MLFNKILFTGLLKPDSLSIIISFICLLVALYKKEITIPWQKIKPTLIALILIVFSTLLGSIISYSKFDLIPIDHIWTEWRILLGCLIIFIEIIVLGYKDFIFLKWVIYAFLTSFLVIITPYFPDQFINYILEGSNRFGGLIGSSNFYPTLMILPTMIILYFIIETKFINYKYTKIILLFLILSLSIGLIIWSGSRSGWLGLGFTIFIFSLISIKNSQQKIRKLCSIILITIFACLISFVILPTNAKTDITNRINYIITPENMPIINIDGTVSQKIVTNITIIDSVSNNQDRLNIWENAIPFIIYNPFGYGLSYSEIINIRSGSGEHSGVHSFPLEVILIGGLLSLASITYLIVTRLISFVKYQIKNSTTDIEVILISSFLGLLICSLFLSLLLIRWFWIELAILIIWQTNREISEDII